MIKVKGYEHYFGGKSGDGTYQTLINHIPQHDIFYSLFLGNCGVARHIRPAAKNILCDLDKDVVMAWADALKDTCGYYLNVCSALEVLEEIQGRHAQLCEASSGNLPARHAENCDTTGNPVAPQKNAIPDPKRFIFLDPPYRLSSRRSQRQIYKFEMTDGQHVELLKAVTALPPGSDVMITHYPDPVYDMYLQGWQTKDFYSMTRNGLQLERMYMNYTLDARLHDYHYLGGDFREREKFNRIKNNFIKKLNRLPAALRNSILSTIAEKSDTGGKTEVSQ